MRIYRRQWSILLEVNYRINFAFFLFSILDLSSGIEGQKSVQCSDVLSGTAFCLFARLRARLDTVELVVEFIVVSSESESFSR